MWNCCIEKLVFICFFLHLLTLFNRLFAPTSCRPSRCPKTLPQKKKFCFSDNFALQAGFFCIGATVCIGRDFLCLPYAVLFRECYPLTLCHMSCVPCHMSHVMWNRSILNYTFLELVSEGGAINGAYPVYFLLVETVTITVCEKPKTLIFFSFMRSPSRSRIFLWQFRDNLERNI